MPYNQNYTTYSTKRASFVGNPEQRTGTSPFTQDQQFINFFPEVKKEPEGVKYFLRQRAGLAFSGQLPAGGAGGVYYWNGQQFTVIGSTLYRGLTAIQTITPLSGYGAGFYEFINGTNQKFLIVLDGNNGWVINTAYTVTRITSANFPTPHWPKAAVMDGYLFVAKFGTADIYNCNLVDPLTWTAGSFISAEAAPDNLVALCRQNNYIVAIGDTSMEYFYDNGTTPGTPLARNVSATHQIGCPAPETLVNAEEQLVFVGQTQMGGYTVWLMNGLTPTEISNEVVRQSISAEGGSLLYATGYCIRSKGHKFYVLNLSHVTWVYDFETQMWHQWTGDTVTGGFQGRYATDGPNGGPILLDRATGMTYEMRDSVTTDATGSSTTTPIISTAISEKMDFGNMNSKFMHRLTLVCDVPQGTTPSCSLSWTDDDYQTYSTARTLTISNTMPSITQLGRFRRRAFKLVYSDAYPLRLEGLEVDINSGTQ